jgi:hypothetical protein
MDHCCFVREKIGRARTFAKLRGLPEVELADSLEPLNSRPRRAHLVCAFRDERRYRSHGLALGADVAIPLISTVLPAARRYRADREDIVAGDVPVMVARVTSVSDSMRARAGFYGRLTGGRHPTALLLGDARSTGPAGARRT